MDGAVDRTSLVSIMATGALKAGETVLDRQLSIDGQNGKARALVWRLTAGLEAVSVTLYDAGAADELPLPGR